MTAVKPAARQLPLRVASASSAHERATPGDQWKFFEMLFNQAYPLLQPDLFLEEEIRRLSEKKSSRAGKVFTGNQNPCYDPFEMRHPKPLALFGASRPSAQARYAATGVRSRNPSHWPEGATCAGEQSLHVL